MRRILLKSTIPYTADDWHIGRFSSLCAHLEGLRGPGGERQFAVDARDRILTARGDDADLAGLGASSYDQLWLFAVDEDGGLTAGDCEGIDAFRARGGGCLVTRDHQDLGACVARLSGIGAAHHFHTHNPEPFTERHSPDDQETPSISWPNYHSGSNGDAQRITLVGPTHALLVDAARGRPVRCFPAHPHEGAVGVPPHATASARAIATGTSKTTGRSFNLAVVFEEQHSAGRRMGRAVAQSTFHHFTDYNWDVTAGCPSFVVEPPGRGLDAEARADIHAYTANLARWL
jgi:hypothetical protein